MARAVMPAIFSRRPRKSASSSSISLWIMVDSMSATSSFLRRPSAARMTASTPGRLGGVAVPSKGRSQAMPSASQLGHADGGAVLLQGLDGGRDDGVGHGGTGGIGDQDEDVFHAPALAAGSRICKQCAGP